MLRGLWAITVVTIAAAWLAFVGSFFLPAIEGIAFVADSTPVLNGWGAFVDTFSKAPFFAVISGASLPEVALVYSLFVNPLLLLSPVAVVLAPRHAVVLGAVLFMCGVCAVVVASCLNVVSHVGFYVWVASFFVMSLGCTLASLSSVLHNTRQRGEFPERGKSSP